MELNNPHYYYYDDNGVLTGYADDSYCFVCSKDTNGNITTYKNSKGVEFDLTTMERYNENSGE